MKLLSSIKVQLIRMDDPNIVLYVQDFDETKTYYYTKKPNHLKLVVVCTFI